ncbi:DNA primase family protein [Megasphaera vaginalis (ex Bordigoni et al. 2020)]|uniref:DNA primase family protein n=1 Tax=Megasphaera vaginalis (ex Bordigoni et al. 2020) TaxID=2045301 RepID=UPI000C7ADA51|nr:phage/plasmid primase, P4 family [Megasphaera vaginalis (ex Bordigoni et al. 2020)]
MNQTFDELVSSITEDYLEQVDLGNPPSQATIKRELLDEINREVNTYNKGPEDPPGSGEFPTPKKGKEKYDILKALPPSEIGRILIVVHRVCRVAFGDASDEDNCLVGVYATEGEKLGTYDTSEKAIRRLIRQYNRQISSHDIDEVYAFLKDEAPLKKICRDRDLIAVGNGIYDYANKMLMDFDPELVFTTKSHVHFVDGAINPHITMPDGANWDVESWMQSLSDDPDVQELLWQTLGAIIRPNVPWHRSVWLYSKSGNNGKGTLCRLMRNLCGEDACASISITGFGNQYGLSALTRVSAVIVDENDTSAYLDKAAALKAVITGDPVLVDRKFKDPLSLVFHGFMVQCINALPRFKDKSDSAYRRLLLVPMEKRFEGCERKYIKDDYLGRQDVLEYVLYKLLATTDYYELVKPQACLDLLEEYKQFNDPIREFMATVMDELKWDLVPWQFLYDLYVKWFARNNSAGKPVGINPFRDEVRSLLVDYPGWNETENPVRSTDRMDAPEPLIAEYDVRTWMNGSYTGSDIQKRCQPDILKDRYRGLVREASAVSSSDDFPSEED